MSQRIEDTLGVLSLMKKGYARGKDARSLRIEATKRWAELRKLKNRGVTQRTVHAHLMGKDTRNTLSFEEFDQIAQEWLNGSPRALRDWLMLVVNQSSDHEAITRFFQRWKSDGLS